MTEDVCSVGCCSSKNFKAEQIDARKWNLKEVLEYKKRGFSALGFPYGGTVTVHGWKLKDFCKAETKVCPDCVEAKKGELIQQQKEQAQQNKRYSKNTAIVLVIGVLPLVLGKFLNIGVLPSTGPFIIIFIIDILIFIVLLLFFSTYLWPPAISDPLESTHDALIDKLIKSKLQGKQKFVKAQPPSSEAVTGSIYNCTKDMLSTYKGKIIEGDEWTIIHPLWLTNSPSPGPASSYDLKMLKESVNNLGYKTAADFLNAGTHGEVV